LLVLGRLLQAGWTLTDNHCADLYDALLRGEKKLTLLRYQGKSLRYGAHEFAEVVANAAPQEDEEPWLRDSLEMLEEKLHVRAQELGFPADQLATLVGGIIDGVRRRSLTARPVLGSSLIMNPDLRHEFPDLMEKTGIRGLLSVLVGAANDQALSLCKEMVEVLDKELEDLKGLKEAVGEKLDPRAQEQLQRWQRSRDGLNIWADDSSNFMQRIKQTLNDTVSTHVCTGAFCY
jgi:hypothetical protein